MGNANLLLTVNELLKTTLIDLLDQNWSVIVQCYIKYFIYVV